MHTALFGEKIMDALHSREQQNFSDYLFAFCLNIFRSHLITHPTESSNQNCKQERPQRKVYKD